MGEMVSTHATDQRTSAPHARHALKRLACPFGISIHTHPWCFDLCQLATWNALGELKGLGLVKLCGLSNTTLDQLRHILANSRHKVDVVQAEIHPYLQSLSWSNSADRGAFLALAIRIIPFRKRLVREKILRQISKRKGKLSLK